MRRKILAGLLGSLLLAIGGLGPATAQKQAGVIETADAGWSGVQTELLEARRMSDDTVRVRWRWRNTTDKKVHLFSGGEGDKALKQDAYVLDPKNKKKHLVVTDSQGKLIGSALAWTDLGPKESLAVWAKFPAPPADVDKITVVIPKTPPFEDIAISK
jgi:hypothetical protein